MSTGYGHARGEITKMGEDLRILVISDRRASPDGGEHFHDYVAGQVYARGTVPPMSPDLAAEAMRDGWGELTDGAEDASRVHADPAEPDASCEWCPEPFTARTARGGPDKRFCSDRCRSAFHRALRRWARREFEAGRVTVSDLRKF